MLAARHITRRFGPLLALDGVDFDARPGEIVALLGENGAGKTTLMNILAGRLRPDAGSIELFGRALRPGLARRRAGGRRRRGASEPDAVRADDVGGKSRAGRLRRGRRAREPRGTSQ